MQKIAIISDIHGNLPALQAVLKDINTVYKADQIYCLGDLTDGAPWHNEVIELIQELNIPTIMGNHDERIAFDYAVHALSKHSLEEQDARLKTINHTKETIRHDNKQFLSGLVPDIRLDYDNLSCLLVHGSPRSNEEYIYEDHDESLLIQMFDETNSDVIITGHTHLSFIRSISTHDRKDKLFINAGSLGRTKEKNGGKAVYLRLTINETGEINDILKRVDATLCEVDYSIHEVISGIKESEVPNFYAHFWEKHLQYPPRPQSYS